MVKPPVKRSELLSVILLKIRKIVKKDEQCIVAELPNGTSVNLLRDMFNMSTSGNPPSLFVPTLKDRMRHI